MPYDQLARWLAGGAAAAAALCTWPQAAACAALAGAALLAVGSATVLYAALVNSNWDAYRAYERVIAEANAGLHPYPPEITATPGAPAQPGYYPGERLNEDPFAGTVIYRATQLARTSTPEPEPDPTPSPTRIPIPYDTCTSTPRPKRCDPDAFRTWWNGLPLAGGIVNANWYRYEQQVTRDAPGTLGGTRPKRVPAVTEFIDADGALVTECRLLDAKYESIPPWADIDDEVRRYRLALLTPTGIPGSQPIGLEFRISNSSLRQPLEAALIRGGFALNTNGFVTEFPYVR
jgi:hypothetical protein